MSKPKLMTWDGIEYPSQAALAEVKGVSIGTVSYWYRCGYTSDDDLFKGVPTVLNGKRYKSRAAAARDNHMTRGGVYSRLATQK